MTKMIALLGKNDVYRPRFWERFAGFLLTNGPLARVILPAFYGYIDIGGIKLDGINMPSNLFASDDRRAGAGEWLCKRLAQRLNCFPLGGAYTSTGFCVLWPVSDS